MREKDRWINQVSEYLMKNRDIKLICAGIPGCEEVAQFRNPAPRTVFLLSGKKNYFIDAEDGVRQVTLTPGIPLFVPAWGLLKPGPITPYKMMGIVYYRDFIRLITIKNTRSTGKPVTSEDTFYHTSRPVGTAGRQMLQMLGSPGSLNLTAANHVYQALLHQTLDCLQMAEPETSPARDTWRRIKNHIMENLSLPELSRESAARVLNLSPAYVSQVFSKYEGMPFNKFVNQERIAMARNMLAGTDRPLKDVARACGFSASDYFIKVFGRCEGMTPGAFRLLNKTESSG